MEYALSSFTLKNEFDEYRRSARLGSCAENTRREYLRVLDHLEYEIGDVVTTSVDRAWLRSKRDEWAVAGHRAATIRLQILKNALEPSMSDGLLDRALFDGLLRVKRPHGLAAPNLAWTDDEVDAAITRCIGLARYAGLRRADVCSITEASRSTVALRGGRVQHRLRYFADKGQILVDIKEDRRLTELLDHLTSGSDETLAFNGWHMPWKPRQLDQALKRVLNRLELEGSTRASLTLHGLRHARGVELAEAGASDAEIMSQLGHKDEQSARVYRSQASRSSMADRAQRLVDQRRLRKSR
jgi:integrase